MTVAVSSVAWTADPRSSRQQASANGAYSIRLVEVGDADCRVEAFADSTPQWQVEKCLGTPDDFFFISNDGQHFWVVKAIPEKPRPSRKEAPSAIMKVIVATLYDRTGAPLKRMRLGDLMPQKSRDKVRQLGRHFQWLQGVGGVPGQVPRVNDQNEVELDLLDSKTVRLKF